MKINPRTVVVLAIIAIAVGGFVLLRDRLPGSADSLAVGECFDVPTTETAVSEVQRHPCNEAHTAEVVGQGDMAGDSGATYPLDTAIREFASELCVRTFNAYTGRDVETDEEFTVGWFYPTRDSWSSGDREVTCYLTRIDDAPITGSLKKAS